MALKLYNTLTQKKEVFTPLREGAVGMYNCGPTVYNYAHIGNLRAYVFADTLRRTLLWHGYKVTQVINITDVGHLTSDSDEGEDKIEKGAAREGKTAKEISEFFTRAFFDDIQKLNIEKAEYFPKATEHVQVQIALIQKLEEKGFTYRTSDGIYFDTQKFPDYGKLARLDIEGLKAGARVEANEEKKNRTDFALWKFSKAGEKRQQEWDSPWGVGFPGWHLECSAMSMKYLGETFDIHTGGIDHVPVHHTNEIAQSEAANGKKFVNYWMHSGFVNVEGDKMAKSSENFVRLETLEKKEISPLSYRYWLLTAHYRKTVNFTWKAVLAAGTALSKVQEAFAALPDGGTVDETWKRKFEEAINDDLNTPKAIAVLFDLIHDEDVSPADKKATIQKFDTVLGLGLATFKKTETEEIPELVQKLADDRALARTNKEWEKSDALRDEIAGMGYSVKDTPEGQKIIKL